jgi:NAD-dependent dihydropyrimidine dehydrogenase PreA subunit
MECVEFCPHDVFEVRENDEQKLVVKIRIIVSCSAAPAGRPADWMRSISRTKIRPQPYKEIRKEEAGNE